MELLHHYQCVIDDIDGDTVFASLVDCMSYRADFEELAEIPVKNFGEVDPSLIARGAIFDWRIIRDDDGNIKSVFDFCRDLWTQEDIDAANARAEKLAQSITPDWA